MCSQCILCQVSGYCSFNMYPVQGPATIPQESGDLSRTTKHKKKHQIEKRSQKISKQEYAHSRMVTLMKDHSGQVADMDFLLSCAEGGSRGTSSRGEENKENNLRSQPTLTRWHKKSRTRKYTGSPSTVKKKDVMRQQRQKTIASEIPMKLIALILPPELNLYTYLRCYILSSQQLLELAFPVELSLCPGRAVIYKASDPNLLPMHLHSTGFDTTARESLPKENSFCLQSFINNPDLYMQFYCHSRLNRYPPGTRAVVRKCVRCYTDFLVTNRGEYLTNEQCTFHWGKLYPNKEHPLYYTCCSGNPYSDGCTLSKLHVWSGISVGTNGPLEGFVRTCSLQYQPPDHLPAIYGLDCEMCYTTAGIELVRVTVVARDGKLVYDSLVHPESYVIDYNTRFSGVSARDYNNGKSAKSLREVQNDLKEFIKADTILIGHGLENDLRALKMIHTTCVDTSVIFPHHYGLPYRRSLKSLALLELNTSIQTSSSGHDSFEDARTCISLMLYRIQQDFIG